YHTCLCSALLVIHDDILLLMPPLPLSTTHLPYTTLFRSRRTKEDLPLLSWHGFPSSTRLSCWRYLSVSCSCSRERYRSLPSTDRSEEHTSELQSRFELVCRLLLEKKNMKRGILLMIRRYE